MIQLNSITLAFGERRLVEGVTTRFECGRMVALLGRNGTGKSTLLRAMAKLGDVADIVTGFYTGDNLRFIRVSSKDGR